MDKVELFLKKPDFGGTPLAPKVFCKPQQRRANTYEWITVDYKLIRHPSSLRGSICRATFTKLAMYRRTRYDPDLERFECRLVELDLLENIYQDLRLRWGFDTCNP